MPTPVTGVESVELAPMGVNGAMPTTGWIKIVDIEDESVSFTVPPLEKIKVRVEDKSGIRFVLPGETDGASFVANSLDLSADKAAILFKGVFNGSPTEFNAPTVDEIVSLAIRFTSKAYQGKKFQLSIPAAAVTAGIVNNFTKTGFVALSMEGEATTPVDAAGAAVSPWGYKFLEVTPTT